MNPMFEHEFYDALIAETTFPALDGSSKESGYIKCKIQPERRDHQEGGGRRADDRPDRPQDRAEDVDNAAFRLNIDTIDDMRYTNKIESFTIKQGIKKSYTGADRFSAVRADRVTFPNLTGTISLEYADKLLQWHHDYIVQGKKDRASQKTGSIEFLTPDRKNTIFQINLFEVGLSFCGLEQSSANQETIKRVKFELYVHAWSSMAPARSASSSALRRGGDQQVVEHVGIDHVGERSGTRRSRRTRCPRPRGTRTRGSSTARRAPPRWCAAANPATTRLIAKPTLSRWPIESSSGRDSAEQPGDQAQAKHQLLVDAGADRRDRRRQRQPDPSRWPNRSPNSWPNSRSMISETTAPSVSA